MSCMRLIGRLIALFVVFIFVIVTPPLILAYNAQQAAVDGEFLDELFEDTELFEAAIPEIAKDMERDIGDHFETRDTSIARLDADDWERIIYAIAPPTSMQKWAQDGLEGWHDWVRRGGRFLDDIVIPFGEIRANIIDDPERTVLRTLTEAQPECSPGQEPLGGPDDLIPQCRPPEARLDEFLQQVAGRWRERPREMWRQMMPDEIADYPDNISVADFIERQSGEEWNTEISWRASRWGLRAARWLFAAFIAGQCVVALVLVVLFAARNWREALRWAGTPMILAGLLTLLLALLFFIGAEIGTWFIPDEDVPIGVQEVLEDTARAFSDEVWPPMAWQAGVLVLVGCGLWVLSFYAPVPRELAAAPTMVTTAPAPPVEPEAITLPDTASAESLENQTTVSGESPPGESLTSEQAPPTEDETGET